MMRWRNYLSDRGDTLVEVTIALAILSLVLVTAFVASNRSFALGQTSKERSMLASVAQQQADGLKSFRDSHTWQQFACGSSGCPQVPPSSCQGLATGVNTTYCGIRIGTFNNCSGDPTNQCFHMELRRVNEGATTVTEWVPVIGALSGLVGNGYVYFNIGTPPPGTFGNNPGSVANDYYFNFYQGYGNVQIGTSGPSGSATSGSNWITLTDLDGFR